MLSQKGELTRGHMLQEIWYHMARHPLTRVTHDVDSTRAPAGPTQEKSIETHLAVDEKLEQGNWLLCAILVHARHVEVIQEDHEALPHWWPIGVLGALLCSILLYKPNTIQRQFVLIQAF